MGFSPLKETILHKIREGKFVPEIVEELGDELPNEYQYYDLRNGDPEFDAAAKEALKKRREKGVVKKRGESDKRELFDPEVTDEDEIRRRAGNLEVMNEVGESIK